MPVRPEPAEPHPLRERRRTQDVRAALLSSAARLFARHGFARTTTREIAEHAGVAETAVYRHFGTKQELFRAAVVAPLEGLCGHYADRWWPVVEAGADHVVVLRGFLADFYDVLAENRDAVVALLMALGDPGAAPAAEHGRLLLGRLFASLTDLARGHSSRTAGLAPVFTDEMTTRFVVGMLMLVTAFDTWFLPSDPAPSKDRVLDVMASMVLPGLIAGRDREGGDRAVRR